MKKIIGHFKLGFALFLSMAVPIAGCGLRSRQSIVGDIDKLVLEPFHRWKATPARSCESKDLFDAVRMAKAVAANSQNLEMRQRSAMYQLEIADQATNANCLEFADVVYRDVVKVYIGPAYAAHRQRADIGIADVREARQRLLKP